MDKELAELSHKVYKLTHIGEELEHSWKDPCSKCGHEWTAPEYTIEYLLTKIWWIEGLVVGKDYAKCGVMRVEDDNPLKALLKVIIQVEGTE